MQDGLKDPIDIHIMQNQGWVSLLASTHRNYSTLVYAINIAQHVQEELTTTRYRNWEESSSAMERDLIIDGFCQAKKVHGLRYMRFIGDGDSSVYPHS